jgi:hypothetical protein
MAARQGRQVGAVAAPAMLQPCCHVQHQQQEQHFTYVKAGFAEVSAAWGSCSSQLMQLPRFPVSQRVFDRQSSVAVTTCVTMDITML